MKSRPCESLLTTLCLSCSAEQSLRRKARERDEAEQRAREAAEREAQRQAEREEYLRPADRGELARQLQQNQATPSGYTHPVREYTDAEIDAMSSDDMRRLGIVACPLRVEERQGNSGTVLRPERTGERRDRKIKFSQEELAAQEYRKRVIAQDQSERRKVKQDLEQAQREKQEKRTGK